MATKVSLSTLRSLTAEQKEEFLEYLDYLEYKQDPEAYKQRHLKNLEIPEEIKREVEEFREDIKNGTFLEKQKKKRAEMLAEMDRVINET